MRGWDAIKGVLLYMALCVVVAAAAYALYPPKQPPLPEVTEYEKLRLEMDALRRTQDAILIYVRPNDEYAEKFAKTLKEAGIPNLPGVTR